MRSSNILIVGLLVLNASKCVLSAKKFWWMDDASVFGGSNQRKQNGFSQQLQLPKQPQQNQISQVVTECPAGTKCVQDFFCNENAVMVSYRVSLTPEQKKRRGDLIPCLNGNDGNFDVCCSTATSGQLQQQEYLPRILTYYNHYIFVYIRQERLITNFVYIFQIFLFIFSSTKHPSSSCSIQSKPTTATTS